MHWIDIIIVITIAIAVGFGFWRGFIHETLSLLAWVAGFIIARIFAPDVAQWLQQHIDSRSLILLLSWVIPFLSTFFIFSLLKVLLISLISIAGLRPVDRMLGAVFGAIKGALLVTAAVLVVQLVLSRSGEPFKSGSRLVPHFQVVALWMLKTLDQETELNFDKVINSIGQAINAEIKDSSLDDWKKKLGMSKDEIVAILEDEKQLEELKALINDPEAMKRLKSSLSSDN